MVEGIKKVTFVVIDCMVCPELIRFGFFILLHPCMEKKFFSEEDHRFMLRALELAERGRGFVNPNPLVGAVIVRNGKIIGEGWHERYGGLHAERNAFRNCKEDPQGATLYVTLEPCCHYGKTPPCTEAVIGNGIARVVVGLTDPNPLVGGKGLEQLKQAGIVVETGLEEEALKEQNKIFLKYIKTRLPWVVLKTAMTLDGKIATATGDSKWVTGEEARYRVQKMRAEYMGILIGTGTLRMDDPLLNCRLEGEVRQPIRIVADSRASVTADSQIMQTAQLYPVLIAHTSRAEKEKLEGIRQWGAQTLCCEEENGRIDLKDMLQKLGERGIDSILLEGGGELAFSFLEKGLIDEVFAFMAPKMVGGKEAKTPLEGEGIQRMSEAVRLCKIKTERIGEDILIRGEVEKMSNS